MSRPPPEDKDKDKVYAITQEENPRNWREDELLMAQKADKETLSAANRLVSTGEFAWPKQRGGLMKLLRLPAPEPQTSPHKPSSSFRQLIDKRQ